MKIGFQGWFLSQPHTGIGQHSWGLLRALLRQKNHRYLVVVPKAVFLQDAAQQRPLRASRAYEITVLKPKNWLLHPALKKWFWERIQVPAFFAQKKLTWEYYPYPCPLPRSSPHKRAMTVHDLILWKDPRYQGNRLKTFYHRQARRSLVFMDHLFTVSKTVHSELGIPAATVLPNGLPLIPKDRLKNMILSRKFHLNHQDALVYLGGYDLRKNVPELVEVFSDLKEPLRLLLIGEAPIAKAPHVSRWYPKVPEYPHVTRLGSLSDDEVYAVLKSAFAFISFSDSEGFNLPLLEAMAVGTPAIVKDIPVHREVSQGSALFLPDTHQQSSLKKSLSAIIALLHEKEKRKEIVAAQKKAARAYSWKKTAHIFLNALHTHGT